MAVKCLILTEYLQAPESHHERLGNIANEIRITILFPIFFTRSTLARIVWHRRVTALLINLDPSLVGHLER